MNKFNIKLFSFINGAWYFDNIFNYYISTPLMNFGLYITYKLIDNQILEYLGPSNTYKNIVIIGGNTSNYHIGKISIYVLVIIIFMFFFIN